MSMHLSRRADRGEMGRRPDEPGDGFVYLVILMKRVEERFEWLEVTEVFTTVPASRIEGAMRAWNGIPDRDPVDVGEFRKGLPRGRPSRIEQRIAADRVIAQVERKLAKVSYHELLARYGYGTLVVGLPLWFAVPPDDPFRAENVVDDFTTRTKLGLEDVNRIRLGRSRIDGSGENRAAAACLRSALRLQQCHPFLGQHTLHLPGARTVAMCQTRSHTERWRSWSVATGNAFSVSRSISSAR